MSIPQHYIWTITNIATVYFIYPETCGVRLEDMDQLFGDSTTAMGTPATRAETGSLMGVNSPVPSMDLRRGIYGTPQTGPSALGPSNAIPGLDIDPPHVNIVDGKPQYQPPENEGEGVGGWISRMVNRDGGSIRSGQSGNGKYKPLDQDDEDA